MQEAAWTYIIGLTLTNPTSNLLILVQKAATTLQLSLVREAEGRKEITVACHQETGTEKNSAYTL